MSASTSAMTSRASVNTLGFWELLWRTSGIQFVGFFILAYVIYGSQPQVGASPETLVAFYHGDRIGLVWIVVVTRVLLKRTPPTRVGW